MPLAIQGAYGLGGMIGWCGERGLCSCGDIGGDAWLMDGKRGRAWYTPGPGGECAYDGESASAPSWSFKEGRLIPTSDWDLGDAFWMGGRFSCTRLAVGEAKDPVLGVYILLPGLYGVANTG